MASSPSRPGTLRSLFEGVVALLFTRAELLHIELEEQQERLVGNVVLVASALILLFAAIVALLLFVLLVLPPQHRALAMGLFAASFLATSGILLVILKRRVETAPKPLALTLGELKKDWQAVSGKDVS